MTDERFNYLMADAKPIFDAIRDFKERNNLDLFQFTNYSAGHIDLDIMSDIDPEHFEAYTASFGEDETVTVSKRTIRREH